MKDYHSAGSVKSPDPSPNDVSDDAVKGWLAMPQEMTPATSELSAQVGEAFSGSDDRRLSEVIQAAIRNLHAFAQEVRLTREEWMAGIRFLTEVGARCDDSRQEFILLSDTLGLSSLVEMINRPPAPGASEPTVLGPFYVPDAPACPNGGSIVFDPATGGEPLVMRGTVRDLHGDPIPHAGIDVWQVQPNGLYDIEEDPAKRNLRARFQAGLDGVYEFSTVRPVDYTIPDDGPVGAMLKATGRQAWRPAHIHFSITADGFRPLVTHVFDRSSPWLHGDAVFGVRSSLVTDIEGPECDFDFVLEGIQ